MNDSLGALLAIAVLWLVFKFAFGSRGNGSARPGAITGPRARAVPQELVNTVQAMFPQIPEASIRYDLSRTGSADATCDRILREGTLPNPPSAFFLTPAAGNTRPERVPTPNQNHTQASGQGSGSGTNTPGGRGGSSAKAGQGTKLPQDLISRYGLQARVVSSESAASDSAAVGDDSTASAWVAASGVSSTSDSRGKGKARALDDDVSFASSSGSAASPSKKPWSDSREEREAALRKRKEDMILEARRRLLDKRNQVQEQAGPA